jgi:hypothetical protein
VISIILYGRNDSYGYNLHKRAALSLNCMAEVLSDPDDEVLFVDYNTPDDFPTFPEAIQDTLTEKAKQRLRILRVRPAVHARFRSKSHLLALEPVARNVALRRSNPTNRWVLSTNTDMIFVPRRPDEDLSAIAARLPDGYWGTPRFELPETLWESLDRRDAAGVIAQIGRWGWDYHLNEIVYALDFIRFDGPGDFQLMPRVTLCAMHGFHEGMLVGWHVDSNIAKRMSLVYGKVGDLSERLFAYHCDHTRQVTPAHKREAVENSTEDFVHSVTRPELPEQAESWGCPDDPVEEIRLSCGASVGYVAALDELLAPKPLAAPLTADYTGPTWDQTGYTPQHVLPFLLDLFASAPRAWSVAWIGGHQAMFDLFAAAWDRLGFEGRILVPKGLPGGVSVEATPVAARLPVESIADAADVFIFDIARRDGQNLAVNMPDDDKALLAALEAMLGELMDHEAGRRAQRIEPRRFVGINAVHNRFEPLFGARIAAARTPFSVRMRHGFVYPAAIASELDCLPRMAPGGAGRLVDGRIRARPLVHGVVAVGPQAPLPPGRYEARFEFEVMADPTPPIAFSREFKRRIYRLYRKLPTVMRRMIRSVIALSPGWHATFAERRPPEVAVEVALGPRALASLRIGEAELEKPSFRIPFEVTPAHYASDSVPLVDVRIVANGFARFAIARLEIAPVVTTATSLALAKAA